MIPYAARRVALLVPVLLAASIVIFLMLRLLPGDVADAMLGTEDMSLSLREQIRTSLGLDRPLHEQYLGWLGGILRGDLGISMRSGQGVTEAIGRRLPLTVQLALTTVVVATVIAIPLGIASALRPGGPIDTFARLVALVGLSVPNFLVATILILVTSLYLRWHTEAFWVNPFVDPWASARQMVLPVTALATHMMAVVMRMTRSSMLEVLSEDYVRTARAKGAGTARLVLRHALRNAFIPVLTVVGLQLGNLLAGTVIVEQVFGLPGVGTLFLNAVYQRDYVMVQGTVFFITFAYAVVNLAVDMTYGLIDPRIRYA